MGSPVGEVSYTYDAANRLTSVGGVSYTWDDNGNLTSDGVLSYTYDHANRLTQVTEGSLTTQFAYNGDGVRASKTTGGDTTQYVLGHHRPAAVGEAALRARRAAQRPTAPEYHK